MKTSTKVAIGLGTATLAGLGFWGYKSGWFAFTSAPQSPKLSPDTESSEAPSDDGGGGGGGAAPSAPSSSDGGGGGDDASASAPGGGGGAAPSSSAAPSGGDAPGGGDGSASPSGLARLAALLGPTPTVMTPEQMQAIALAHKIHLRPRRLPAITPNVVVRPSAPRTVSRRGMAPHNPARVPIR